jgi:3-deoxy-manno-octulosonate cytidylyltransferase (CMP-KDO synthetase)
MSFTVVIPSRYGSTRLPGKPLADIAGKPMVQRVAERALASAAERVVVATDDERVLEVCQRCGVEALMTRADHASGTDRIQEVAVLLGLPDDALVVNVQGDEPLIPPAVIDQVARNLEQNTAASIATLCEPVADAGELFNPNAVKVVTDLQGLALYFSRAPIPWERDAFGDAAPAGTTPVQARRHLGIYAYRVALLHQFVGWPVAELEALESLEQLRAMANGARIHVAEAVAAVPPGVDTPADLEQVRALLA